jgi:hypothetical protein
MDRNRATAAYQRFVTEISQRLYKHDPDGIGASIDAPSGEYDDRTAVLVSSLSKAGSPEDARRVVLAHMPNADDSLVAALVAAQQTFVKDKLLSTSFVAERREESSGAIRFSYIIDGSAEVVIPREWWTMMGSPDQLLIRVEPNNDDE